MSIGENIQARLADRTGRGLAFYEAMFGSLPIEEGQTLLNVGAGDSALGNELPDIDVIDVDYGYHILPPLYDIEAGEQAAYRGAVIAAKANKLPLEDSTADCTVVSHLFMHLSRKAVGASIDELVRVTAEDGKILIGPVWDESKVTPELENDYVAFRSARYRDGWNRTLGSMAITVPGDKTELNRMGVSKSLAASEVFGNESFLRRLPTFMWQATENLAAGGINRRYDLERAHSVEPIIANAPAALILEIEDQPG